MSVRQRILKHARDLFLTFGVKSITLDEIAKDLGISKKTIYQYFENKASLVYEVTKEYFELEKQEVERIELLAENALDELIKICEWTSRTMKNMSPTLVYEIAKYYPKAFEIQHEYIGSFVLHKLKENIERGIKEDLYRKDLDPDLVARIRISQFDFSSRQNFFPPDIFDIWGVQLELFILYMYGIVSVNGRKYLDEHLSIIPRRDARLCNKMPYGRLTEQ